MPTKAAKQRAYTVLMYGLSEERRVCGMDEETWRRRCREILEDCEVCGLAGDTPQETLDQKGT